MSEHPRGPDDPERNRLREEAAAATAAARNAYRETARLIRLLTVVGEPASAETLVERTLDTLSDVFSAAVAAVVRIVAGQVEIVTACGIPEDTDASSRRTPVSALAAALPALFRPGWLELGPQSPAAVPVIAALRPRSIAWAPMGDADRDATLLVLFRVDDEPFSDADVQTLGSVARHLHDSVETAEQRASLEGLARLGQRLTHHLALEPLLQEAAELLRQITGTDTALVATLHDGELEHRAASGLSAGEVAAWPAEPAAVAVRRSACSGEAFVGATAGPERPTAVLGLPVLREGVPVALLSVTRAGNLPFPRHVSEVATVFADHLGAALTNARLYRALAGSEATMRVITDAISDMVAVVDRTGILRYASPSFERMLSLRPDALVGRHIADFVHHDHRDRFTAMIGHADQAPVEEFLVRDGRGGWTWVETACQVGPSAVTDVVLSSRVIVRRKELERELRHRATHDPLTGLANRELVRQRLESALCADGGHGVGLLFCDLDHFKSVNDRLGHEAGDQLLQQVSARLLRCVRDGDLLARLGGDEFVMVLRDASVLDDVDRVGQRVLAELTEPFLLRGEQVSIGASVGGVLGQPGRTTAEALLRDADAAMYGAKGGGRGRLALFDDEAARRSLEHLSLRSELSGALERGELALEYQPIVLLDSGRVVAFEALLRWTHPRLGSISPQVFIPLAEETGAIIPIGGWVVEEASRQLAEWQRLSGRPELAMSLNLSVVELWDPDVVVRALAAADRAGVDPARICLEITENHSLSVAALEQVRELRRAGFRIALDDFGTLQSNFDRLRQFSVDHVKIDKSFVAGLVTDPVDQAAVRATMVIGAALAVDVVAEGVETEEQRSELLRAGCRLGQGYLFDRPLPPHAARALLASDHAVCAPSAVRMVSGGPAEAVY